MILSQLAIIHLASDKVQALKIMSSQNHIYVFSSSKPLLLLPPIHLIILLGFLQVAQFHLLNRVLTQARTQRSGHHRHLSSLLQLRLLIALQKVWLSFLLISLASLLLQSWDLLPLPRCLLHLLVSHFKLDWLFFLSFHVSLP